MKYFFNSKKLGQRGIMHHVVPIAVFVLLFAMTGSYFLLTQSHAATNMLLKMSLKSGSVSTNMCMDNDKRSKASGTPIVTWTCNTGDPAQNWTLVSMNGGFEIKNPYQNICVDDTGHAVGTGPSNRVYLQTWSCLGDKAQIWSWYNGGKYGMLKNTTNNGCINDLGSSTAAGNRLIVFPCTGSGPTYWAEQLTTSGGGSPSPSPSPSPTPTPSPSPVSGGSTSGGCTSGSAVAPCIGSATTGASGWGSPVFDDEFNGTSLNSTYWNSSWFNGGTMNNVSTSASNAAVTGGNLVLTLNSSSNGALVSTNPNGGSASQGFTFTTGYYVEARVFFPGTSGGIYNWPAFWTDGQNWPATGESDIAEVLGGQMTSNYHSPQGANNGSPQGTGWGNGWHTYALDRENGTDTIYWDGKEIRNYSSDDGGAAQYLIANVGCSGSCTTGAASQVKVDYVRVWKKGNTTNATASSNASTGTASAAASNTVAQQNADLQTIYNSLTPQQKQAINCSKLESSVARSIFKCPASP